MAKQKKRKSRSRKGKIVLKQKVELVQKNDNVRVQQPDTLRKMNAQMPRTAGAVFKVKIKKK